MQRDRTSGTPGEPPPRLDLTAAERDSAGEIIGHLYEQADRLGDTVLAKVWRLEAESLWDLCGAA
jgi:hypothetical protein